jgi:hypothetical protein
MSLAIYIWVKLQLIDREEETMYPRSLQRGACPNLAREKPNGLVKTRYKYNIAIIIQQNNQC